MTNKDTTVSYSYKYPFSLKTDKGVMTFEDAYNNFLLYGGQGSGKTVIGVQLLRNYLINHFAGFIYDLKDEVLTKATFYLLSSIPDYPYKLYYINFIDLERSYRFNPINKAAFPNIDYLPQLASDLLDSYLPKGFNKNEFYSAGLGILQGAFVRFYKEFPQYCTIPHVLMFCIHNDANTVDAFLRKDFQSQALASGFLSSKNSPRTQASFYSSLATYIGTLAFNKNVCYVLSGNDFDFNLLDKKNPKLFAISNSYGMQSLLSPIIAMLLKISSRHFTAKNTKPFVYFLDEATTFKIPDFEGMPSMLREYLCSFVFITQSASKITAQYGRESLSSIETNFGNIFFGRTKDSVALTSNPKLFSKIDKVRETKSTNSSNSHSSHGTSKTIEKVEKFASDDFPKLRKGNFIVSTNSNFKEDNLQFENFEVPKDFELPIVRKVTQKDIEENYEKILHEVKSISLL